VNTETDRTPAWRTFELREIATTENPNVARRVRDTDSKLMDVNLETGLLGVTPSPGTGVTWIQRSVAKHVMTIVSFSSKVVSTGTMKHLVEMSNLAIATSLKRSAVTHADVF